VSVHLDGDAVVAGDPVAALAAALDAAGLADRGADVVLVGGPPPPRRAGDVWAAVAPALLASGRAASVGVADWGLADVEAALAAAAAAAPAAPVPRPALARVEAHPLLPQRKLVGVCRRKGVPVVAGGALGGAGGEVRGHPVVAAVARDVQKSPVEVR
jgi:diketogulonate reductase-like aldo/keto reductase